MIHVHSQIADRWLGGGTQQAVAGLDGWLFFRGQDALTQSAGLVLREDQVVDTADTIARLHASLTARGIRFVVAIPPNSATIYPEHVPKWARNSGRRTEYDALLEALHERAVPAVDLRPPLPTAIRAYGFAGFIGKSTGSVELGWPHSSTLPFRSMRGQRLMRVQGGCHEPRPGSAMTGDPRFHRKGHRRHKDLRELHTTSRLMWPSGRLR